MQKLFISLAISILALLSGCGGGGSSTPQTTTPITTTGDGTTTPAQPQVAGKVYLDANSTDMIILYEGGNGIKQTNYDPTSYQPGNDAVDYYKPHPLTWQVTDHTLTLAYTDTQESLTISADSNVLMGKQTAYTAGKPLSLDALDGKTLSESFSLTKDYCYARSYSFSKNTMTISEGCGYGYDSAPIGQLTLETVSGVKDLLHAHGQIGDNYVSVYMALRDGAISTGNTSPPEGGTVLFSQQGNLTLPPRAMRASVTTGLTTISSSSGPAYPGFMTVCARLSLNKFQCPSDPFFSSANSEAYTSNCTFSAGAWFLKDANLTCINTAGDTTADNTGYIFHPNGVYMHFMNSSNLDVQINTFTANNNL